GEDHLVAGTLGLVRRIGLVPVQQVGEQAHVGRCVQRAGADDQAAVGGELEVGLGLAGGRVHAALVADGHVQHGAGHVALARAPGLERTLVAVRAPVPVGIARVGAAAAAAAVVVFRGPLGAARRAVGVRHVAAVGVVGLV